MKTKLLVNTLLLCAVLSANAQLLQQSATNAGLPSLPNGLANTQYTVVDHGPHHRVWAKVTWETNITGKATARTNSYTELANGMAHLVNGKWLDSSDQIQLTPTGAQATNSQHQVAFSGNINAGPVDVTMPDGRHLAGKILGLSYLDVSSGNSVLIAELKDSIGELVVPPGNQVLYPDSFTDFRADVLYVNGIGEVEQLVILRQQPPSPAEWGLNPQTTVIQVITEFSNAPAPQITQRLADDIVDEHLDFGAMQMGTGVAFAIGAETNVIPVTKQWLVMEGRTCLAEQVPLRLLQSELQKLPAPPGHAGLQVSPDSVLHKLASHRLLPERKLARKSAPALKLASAASNSRGVVLDYSLLTSQTNQFTFAGDTTYYVSGAVTLSSNTVVEGGTVIKFTNSPTAKISMSGSLVCQTGPYKMAILTSKDDNTTGDTISGSTGNPTNYNGATYLSGGSGAYKYLRFCYAGAGIYGNPSTTNGSGGVWHCQFVKCGTGLISDGDNIDLHNVLFCNCGTAISVGFSGAVLRGEQLTADQVTTLFQASYSDNNGKLTNSVLTAVANYGTNVTFYNCATNSSSAGFYQTVGAANYYLAADSTNRNAGTSAINTNLLADLRQKTTYPPLVLSNLTVSADTTLAPQAQRDGDQLDLGFHYDPLDFVTYYYDVTNATLTIASGTAIAYYDDTGIWLQDGSQIVCLGTATTPNRFTDYRTVQEQAIYLGSSTPGTGTPVNPYRYTSSGSPGTFRFTQFTRPAAPGGVYHLYMSDSNWRFNPLTLSDCVFAGGQCVLGGFGAGSLTLQNNCFERAVISMANYGFGNSFPFSVRNNLIRYGTVILDNEGSSVWTFKDNAFDSCGVLDAGFTPETADHNAYINTPDRLSGDSAGDVILTNFTYATGPLGNYYQVSTNLINAGSRTADLAGLYHYTTQTNQVKETNSIVDIGFHYVAVTNGVPMDADSDGIPDYLEDANGNGLVNSGETDWQSTTDLGLRVLITRPRNGCTLP